MPAHLLIKQRIDSVEALLVFRAKVGAGGGRRCNGGCRLCTRRRRGADPLGDFAHQLLPVGAPVLRDKSPHAPFELEAEQLGRYDRELHRQLLNYGVRKVRVEYPQCYAKIQDHRARQEGQGDDRLSVRLFLF